MTSAPALEVAPAPASAAAGAPGADLTPPDRWPGRRTRRDRVVDTTAVALAAVLGLVTLAAAVMMAPQRPPALVALDVLLGTVACAALWERRRWPVAVALVCALAACWSDTAGAASVLAVFTVAVHRRWPAVAAVAAAQVASTALYAWWRPDLTSSALSNLITTSVITAAVVAWGLWVRARRQLAASRRQLLESLRERAERAESEQRLRVEQARQTERTRIAREMHDVLAHRISLVSLHAGALEYATGGAAPEVAHAAGVVRASAHEALEDLRDILGVLRAGDEAAPGGALERPQPDLGDLPALVGQARAAGTPVELQQETGAAAPPSRTGRTAYRVVQEALTNARKHAPGAPATVVVRGGPGTGLTVEVTTARPSPGARASGIPGAGTGLLGLAERVELTGGTLAHGPTPEGGFGLRADLPWPA